MSKPLPPMWKFTAGHTRSRVFWRYFKQKNLVAMGYPDVGDLNKLKSLDQIEASSNLRRQMNDFLRIDRGDIMVIYLAKKIVGIGFAKDGIYRYEEDPIGRYGWEYFKRKKVVYLKNFQDVDLTKHPRLYRSLVPPGQQDTIHEVIDSYFKKWIASQIQKYVRSTESRERDIVKRYLEASKDWDRRARRQNLLRRWRQYSRSEESTEHKKLKELIITRRRILGERLDLWRIEYIFPTNDRADLVLIDTLGRFVVVEVEKEAYDAVGFMQALKYKYLLAAEKRLAPRRIRAMLVAKKIEQQVRGLCDKYGVEAKLIRT